MPKKQKGMVQGKRLVLRKLILAGEADYAAELARQIVHDVHLTRMKQSRKIHELNRGIYKEKKYHTVVEDHIPSEPVHPYLGHDIQSIIKGEFDRQLSEMFIPSLKRTDPDVKKLNKYVSLSKKVKDW